MTPERWRRVEQLYYAALQQESSLRLAWLARECDTDDALRAEVESLLAPPDAAFLDPAGVPTIHPSELPTLRPSEFLRSPLAHTFAGAALTPGILFAGRFRIDAEIAAGGMGVVYRATDEKLNQPRALKIAKHGFHAHLSPEAQIAMRVTHRNVCRLFEIHTAETPDGAVDFLSMELIEGGTLGQYLKSHGRFAPGAALDIAEQICAGITAAHSQNLLHRDLKSSNILLEEKDGRPLRAVVTDFGLARESALPSETVDNAHGTTVAGTPAYLAPERWNGKPSSVQTDIFALGIILHEVIAGHMPEGARENPRQLDPTIPARWRRVIAKCLDPDPLRRFSSAAAVAEALSGRTARIRRIAAAAAVLAIASGLIVWRMLHPPVIPARLAVLSIEAPGADAATLTQIRAAGLDLSSRLVRMRPRPPQLVVIPIEETQGISPGQPGLAKQKLGASHVLRATATPAGSHVHLHGEVVDANTNVVLRESSAELGSPSEISARLATLVGAAFNLPRQTPAETVSPTAWPDYAAGLNSLRGHQYKEAIASFEKAAAADPHSALPEARIAEACFDAWELTSDPSWLERGRQQVARAAAMSPDSIAVHLAAGKLNLAPGSWQKAEQEFQRVIQLDPVSSEGWNDLARAYEGMGGRESDAANAYLKAIEVQPDYVGAITNFASFHRRLGHYEEAAEYFERAVRLAPQSGALHANLGMIYSDIGRYPDAEKELNQAVLLDNSLVPAFNNLGALYQSTGRDASAIRVFERARAMGAHFYILDLNLGDSFRRMGRVREAADAYRSGRVLAEKQLLSNPGDATTRAFLAGFAMRLGDRVTGDREISQALYFAPGNGTVIRRAVLYFEAIRQRDKALALLQTAAPGVVRELSRHPDLLNLRQDPKFTALLSAAQ